MRRGLLSILMVAGAGCVADDGAEPGDTDDTGDTGVTTEALTTPAFWNGGPSCTTASGAGWTNRFVPQATDGYVLIFDAHVGEAGGPLIDGVIGFADGPASSFTELGPILRFNPSGTIDARDGSVYRAETTLAYEPGRVHRVWMDVHVTTHTYDARVSDYTGSGQWIPIATDYAFRTEQATMARYDVLASKVDSTSRLTVCEPTVYPPRCANAVPGGGWSSRSYPTQTGPFRVEVDITPTTDPPTTDIVIGLAGAAPAGFADLAAILRLNPSGRFDVRDGSVYRADADVPYVAWAPYRALFAVDPAAHTYSVWIRRADWSQPVLLAADYAVRTEQASLSAFTHLGWFHDGATGRASICDATISY
jgi:hypothetical protein